MTASAPAAFFITATIPQQREVSSKEQILMEMALLALKTLKTQNFFWVGTQNFSEYKDMWKVPSQNLGQTWNI